LHHKSFQIGLIDPILRAAVFLLGHIETAQAVGTNPSEYFVSPHTKHLGDLGDGKRPVGWDVYTYRCSQRGGQCEVGRGGSVPIDQT